MIAGGANLHGNAVGPDLGATIYGRAAATIR